MADVYGCETRTLATRFSDIVNIKDFGATGDGVHDDTKAWEHWQAALERGGVGYIPSGQYRVNGIIRSIVQGCFGNGVDHVWMLRCIRVMELLVCAKAPLPTIWERLVLLFSIIGHFRAKSHGATCRPEL